MDRQSLLALWNASYTEGIWFGSWSHAVKDLTPEQAAWSPKPGSHSIWQLVEHVVFWREVTLDLLAGRPRPSHADTQRRNFPIPPAITEEAWERSKQRLKDTHGAIARAISDESLSLERPRLHLAHDSNHLGQILYLRRMMDLPALES
jgi:hypothetical protein